MQDETKPPMSLKAKPYACPHCPRRFKRRSNLHNHIRVHTGERPHVCDACGKGFKQRSNLNRHRKIHARPAAVAPSRAAPIAHRTGRPVRNNDLDTQMSFLDSNNVTQTVALTTFSQSTSPPQASDADTDMTPSPNNSTEQAPSSSSSTTTEAKESSWKGVFRSDLPPLPPGVGFTDSSTATRTLLSKGTPPKERDYLMAMLTSTDIQSSASGTAPSGSVPLQSALPAAAASRSTGSQASSAKRARDLHVQDMLRRVRQGYYMDHEHWMAKLATLIGLHAATVRASELPASQRARHRPSSSSSSSLATPPAAPPVQITCDISNPYIYDLLKD